MGTVAIMRRSSKMMIRCKPLRVLFCIAACIFASQTTQAANPVPLDGYWRFEPDPADAGLQQQWFNRLLRGSIKLPGILQSQFYFAPDISTETPWVLSLYDRYWYLRDDYKAYTQKGRVK